jgi:hypothetical protein
MAGEQSIEFHPDALAELERAEVWYEEQRPGLESPFSRRLLTPYPTFAMPQIRGLNTSRGTRRFLVHRFPYAVIYSQRPTVILIVAVMHLKRKPGYWKGRVNPKN